MINHLGHMMHVPSQLARPSTLWAKFATHVSPAFNLHPSGGDAFVMGLFDLFSPSLLSVPVFEGHFFSLESGVILQKVGGSFTSKVPKWMESTSAEKFIVELSIWS